MNFIIQQEIQARWFAIKNHEVNYSPYENIGRQDITVHVNFSALTHWGKKYGLETNGFTTQDHFLRVAGIGQLFAKTGN